MKLTTAAVLAFVAASVLGSPVSSQDTTVYARDLYERDGGEGFLQLFEKRKGGGGVLKPGMLKSVSGAVGTMGGRVASSAAQLGLLKHMIPPPPPPPRQNSPYTNLAQVPAVPHVRRRSLARPIGQLGKRPDRAPSIFKAVSGSVGTMGGRVASSAAQLGLLKHMIPPPPPPPPPSSLVHRRAVFPVARPSAPGQLIKNGYTRVTQAMTKFREKTAPARQGAKKAVISFFDGISNGVAV